MKILIALLMLCIPALAQEYHGTGSLTGVTISKPSLHIPMGELPQSYVTIHPDGTIEYGKDYTPDAAAKALWDAMGIERAARNCK